MNKLKAFITIILGVVGSILKGLIAKTFKWLYKSIDVRKPVPSVKSPYLLMPAHQLAQKIRQKEVKLIEYIKSIKYIFSTLF